MTGPSLPSLYGCLVDQGVPREHTAAATIAVSVFLEAHRPAFIAYIEASTAATEAETARLRLVSGEA